MEYGQLPGQQFYLELTIKQVRYNPINIQLLVIREWVFNIIPTVEIMFMDDGYLSEVFPLEDQEDIQITLAKHEDDDSISMTFSLDDYSIGVMGDNRKMIINLVGHLKVEDMFLLKHRRFAKQNSSLVLETIASESGLQYLNPHKVIPSDNMTWYQMNQSNFDFIKHVLKRAYVIDDALLFYARIDNKFVLTSLKSEMTKQNYKSAKFSVANYEKNVKDEDDSDDTIWFTGYSIVNNSSYFNKRIGYGFEYNYYDLNNAQTVKYSQIPKITNLSFRNKILANQSVLNKTYGTLNLLNLYSEKFYESLSRNKFLIDNFFANSLLLNINSLSQVNLMDTIDVGVPSVMQENELNEVLSGKYLVCGIQHEVSTGGIYKKKIALGRNGINKSPDMPDIKTYQVEEL
jgi:hypothetical protein